MFWPVPLPCWSLCGFHGGLPWSCLHRMVELPLVHPWLGCYCRWRAHHGSSSRILPLWGHDLVCQANHAGWVCALLRGWGPTVSLHWSWSGILGWRQTSIWHPLRGPAGSWCWSWKEGGWGHQPEAFPCLVCMWWPGHTAAEEHPLEACRDCCEILQADHLEGLVVCLYDECPPIQVHMQLFTAIYDGQEFSLDVGIMGLGVCEGLAGESYQCSILDDAGSQASHWRVTSLLWS